MTTMADRVEIVAVERIRDELDKLLTVAQPGRGLDLLARTGLLGHLLPELAAMPVSELEPALVSIDDTAPNLVSRLAVVMTVAAVESPRSRLRSLRSPKEQIEAVGAVMAGLTLLASARDAVDDETVRRIEVAVEPYVEEFDAAATTLYPDPVLAYLDRRADLNATGELVDLGPQLSGDEVMAHLDLEPGRDVGEAIRFLAGLRLEEGRLSSVELYRRLDEWWGSRR
jgi:poly(A) polymerase